MTSYPPFLTIGSALWDIIATASRPMAPGFDLPGRIQRQMGGVALNVALAIARTGRPVGLMSVVGRDAEGDALLRAAAAEGVDCGLVARTDAPTDAYLAIENPDGEVFSAVADCASLERAGAAIFAPLGGPGAPPFAGTAIIDGNLPEYLLDTLPALPALGRARKAYVPASPGKAARLQGVLAAGGGTFYVNLTEANILCDAQFPTAHDAAEALFDRGASMAVVTDGPREVTSWDGDGHNAVAPPQVAARTTTGAGDVFLAHHITALEAGVDHARALTDAVNAAASHISETNR